jgi:hypothetical protein
MYCPCREGHCITHDMGLLDDEDAGPDEEDQTVYPENRALLQSANKTHSGSTVFMNVNKSVLAKTVKGAKTKRT